MTRKTQVTPAEILRRENLAADKPLFFVSRPQFFGVKYDINPWMTDNLDAVNRDLALEQWTNFTEILRRCGADVSVLDCWDPRAPDVTFAANAGSFLPIGGEYIFVPSRFRHDERMPEEEFFADQLEGAGAKVRAQIFGDLWFEGDGDLLRLRSSLLAAHGFRTSAEFVTELGRAIPGLVTALELVDSRFYHLDTCFFYHSNLESEVCWYYPKAFARRSLRDLRELLLEMEIKAYEVTEPEAVTFCCNSVGVGPWIITDSLSQRLKDYVTGHGFAVQETPLSEFKKAGGSARCLILRVPQRALSSLRDKTDSQNAGTTTRLEALR